MDNIPIAELVKYLNQIDLCSLILTCKKFYDLYGEYQNNMKKQFDTKANCFTFYLQLDSTLQITQYCRGESKVLTITKYTCQEEFTSPCVIVRDIITKEKIAVQYKDVIHFKFIGQQLDFTYIVDSDYLTLYITLFSLSVCYSNISIYHWDRILSNYQLIIKRDDLIIYYNLQKSDKKEVNYIEIKKGNLLLRIPCMKNLYFKDIKEHKFVTLKIKNRCCYQGRFYYEIVGMDAYSGFSLY